MVSFRFELNENLVTKHHLGSGLAWESAAKWAMLHQNNASDVTVCSVKQIDADTVEIVRRKDTNFGVFYRWFGSDQQGLYERVTINRRNRQTAVDRIDGNFWAEHPFMGRRDLFYMEARNGGDEKLTFVRHDFWVPKLSSFGLQLYTNVDAMLYKRSFKQSA